MNMTAVDIIVYAWGAFWLCIVLSAFLATIYDKYIDKHEPEHESERPILIQAEDTLEDK
jgi:hypothetical protein